MKSAQANRNRVLPSSQLGGMGKPIQTSAGCVKRRGEAHVGPYRPKGALKQRYGKPGLLPPARINHNNQGGIIRVTEKQQQALSFIAENPGCSIKELAEHCGISHQSAYERTWQLKAMGVITTGKKYEKRAMRAVA